ncbi:MAG: endopeptidase La [Candidatus Latescibacterota bacterium]
MTDQPPQEEPVPAGDRAELGIFPLRSSVVYPYMPQQLTASRQTSIRATETAMEGDHLIGVFAQTDPEADEPGEDGLHPLGSVARIHRLWRMPDGSVRLIVQGLARLRLLRLVQTEPYLRATVERLEEHFDPQSMALQAMVRTVQHQFQSIVKLVPNLTDELQVVVANIDHPGRLSDFVASNLDLQLAEHQKLLAELDVERRLAYLTELLARELEILEVGNRIQVQVQEKLGKSQREYYLREQLRQIQKELSGADPQAAEVEDLRRRLQQAQLPEEARQEAERELGRLEQIPTASPEHSVVRTYLDWMLALPWSVSTEDHLDVGEAARILDEDHYGLDKVKERILEYLAVRALRRKLRGPIVCFVGPPGVGKTSLGRSIARALGRRFVRISLGGVHDEAEIRGHRRTYVGALPGRILQGLRKAGTNNPVFMLDEIDKVGADFRGDPAAALLEVLDPEQNFSFSDHYLDVAFDLSRVMFITTANLTAPIPGPLRDRMEEITLSGYTPAEKMQIARRHLLPRQLAEHGLSASHLQLTDEALKRLIGEYTHEAGLRNLERELGAISRKAARRFVEGRRRRLRVCGKQVEELLGPPPYFQEVAERRGEVGVATGLAATAVGGEILFVEAARMPGKKQLLLTGQLGEVMKESAQASLSYLRARAEALGIDPEVLDKSDIHLHVPAGATPKEGPSAGIALTTALASLLTGRPVRAGLAMTGEITLRGRVLPVGGIRDKVMAAQRAGVQTVILPRRNQRDLEEVPPAIRQELRFELVDEVDRVLELALEPPPAPEPSPAPQPPAEQGAPAAPGGAPDGHVGA